MHRIFRLQQRFATKMIAAFVAVILIPTIFTSASFYFVSNSIVKHNVRETSVQITKQAAESLSYIFNAGSDISDLLYEDPRIQRVMARDSNDLKTYLDEQKYVGDMLNNLVYSSSFVNLIYLLKSDRQGWGSGTFSPAKLEEYGLAERDWAKRAARADGGLVWSGLHYDQLSGSGDNTPLVLTLGRVMKNFDNMTDIGYLLVSLNGRKILDTIRPLQLGDTGHFFVVDEAGNVMVDADLARVGRKVANPVLLDRIVGGSGVEFEYKDAGIPYYGVKQPLSNGWMIVGTVPVREITSRLDLLHRDILMSSVGFTLLAIAIGLYIARRVTRPINQLTQQMRIVQQGDFNVRSHVQSADEFGMMSRQFNRMIGEIDRLLTQVKTEQAKKQEAELRAVMNRINPHFLFNTLSTIRWMVKFDQSERAYKGISALLRLLEANMGKKGQFTTLSDELDFIEKYLDILELRYNLHFELRIRADEAARRRRIPRMLIQPLVENAIFHGIVPRGTDGRIEIAASAERDRTEIVVRDDGIGLAPGKSVLTESVADGISEGLAGIGLRHVQESIALYCGPRSGIKLESTEEGTTARIILYANPGEEEERAEDAQGDDR